ncbi:MAG TPA: glycoside hydrolase family 3 C-terminal domain-containing protein, partial [Povalibacter sp.]|nr:glycoside hydrolase family 3 C-terminal domain-containing protein [Povalibacter sp.]
KAMVATGKPVVAVLLHGRPNAVNYIAGNVPAILDGWYLGQEGGTALADVLFGDYNPAGRLPVSFPYESGQEPYYYNHRNTGRPLDPKDPAFKAKYREAPNEALYPFGHGLSYSKFTYTDTKVNAATLPWNGTLTVTTRITNTSARPGEEVAQLYVRDRLASITRPVRELKGFRKLQLAAGASTDVSFQLTRKDLEFVGPDNTWIAEPGKFDVWIAPSSATGVPTQFTLAAAAPKPE